MFGIIFTPIKLVVVALTGLLAAGGVVIGGLYLSDFTVEATIIDTRYDAIEGECYVTVQTEWFGKEITRPLEDASFRQVAACQGLREGNFVEYRIRSERTTIFDEKDGLCIWDSHANPRSDC